MDKISLNDAVLIFVLTIIGLLTIENVSNIFAKKAKDQACAALGARTPIFLYCQAQLQLAISVEI